MGFFKNLKAGMSASFESLTTGAGPSEEALASLTPEQRAAYDANMARVAEAEAQVRGNHLRLQNEHAERFAARPLQGPAGEHLYGPAVYPGMDPSALAAMSGAEQIEASLQYSRDQLADLVRNPFGRPRPAPAGPAAVPPAGAPTTDAGTTTGAGTTTSEDGRTVWTGLGAAAAVSDRAAASPPPGPAATPAEAAAAELAARAAARAPYLAPQRAPIVATRIATGRKRQADDVIAHLAASGLAARPDLVFGVYRVPDHLGSGRMVEWEVVHAATAPLPPAPPPASTWFAGDERWVGRGVGEPSVVDEELVTHWLAAAGLGPEHVLGIARELHLRHEGGGDDSTDSVVWCHVTGVRAFHPPGAGAEAYAGLRGARPVELPAAPPAGVHVEVLEVDAVRQAVQPQRHHPPEAPSPFPYLPSTPQEVLASYLEVVGLQPADCYGVQVTVDEAQDVMGRSQRGFASFSTNRGPAQPCADGKARSRLAGGARVVVAYRDRPEYGEGRQRFVTYMREAWQGDLRNGTGVHRPVDDPDGGLSKGLARLARIAGTVDRLTDGGWEPSEAPHRYCWPPVRR